MPEVISLGEALFLLFASPPGATLGTARGFIPMPGGARLHAAIGLARLGIDVGFVGRVGDDSFGGRLRDLLRQEGVDTSHYLPVSSIRTTVALLATSSRVKRDSILFRGADASLRMEHVDRTYLSGARVLTCGSMTLSARGRDAALQAMRWAREDGVLVAFDANYQPAPWSGPAAARDAIVDALRYADVAKLNQSELRLLCGTDDPREGCRLMLDLGVKLCLITLGADGAWFDDGRVSGSVAGFTADLVDTTGCGDAFLAAFIAGLVTGRQRPEDLDEPALRALVEAANAAGACNAAHLGGIVGLPTRSEIAAVLGRPPFR